MRPTVIERVREVVESELDAGRPFPTRRLIAKKLGLSPGHDFGGRVTYELQKIKVARDIATVADLQALEAKSLRGTYERVSPVPRATRQQRIVRELQEAGLW